MNQTLDQPKSIRIAIITLSDRASAGLYTDHSGPLIEQMLNTHYSEKKEKLQLIKYLIPDQADQLETHLRISAADCDAIFTTGGTGIGLRDITPDVVRKLLKLEIPGIMELIRVKYSMHNPAAALSRSVAGMINQCFIFTMPGSPKAVKEYMTEILLNLDHLIRMRDGSDQHQG